MSLASDFAAAAKDLPKLTKAIVAFASAAAASEGTIAAIAQYTHVIPPGWTQGIAAGVAVLSALAAILTELGTSQPVTEKAREVLAELLAILDVAKAPGGTIAPPPPVPTAISSRQDVTSAINNALQPMVNDAATVVNDVASAEVSKVVDQVISDFHNPGLYTK